MFLIKNRRPPRMSLGCPTIQPAGNSGAESSLSESGGRLWEKLYCIRAPVTRVVKQVATSRMTCSQYRGRGPSGAGSSWWYSRVEVGIGELGSDMQFFGP